MTNEVKILTAIGVVTLAIVVGAAFMFGGKSSPDKTATKITEDQSKILVREDSYIKGPKDAKITLVEFGDFQCPACGAVHPIVGQILNDYNGKIKFVFRQFPLQIHQNANIAAKAAEAAGEQGKFFEMYDALYGNQKEWSESKNPMEFFEKYAQNMGLDVEKLKEDVKSNKYDTRIQKDISDANALGVSATPTFFLNDEKITGGLPYDEFKSKIEAIFKNL